MSGFDACVELFGRRDVQDRAAIDDLTSCLRDHFELAADRAAVGSGREREGQHPVGASAAAVRVVSTPPASE